MPQLVFPAERLARPAVECIGDGSELVWAVPVEVGAFGKYWRNSPLVFSLVPRCQRLEGRRSR